MFDPSLLERTPANTSAHTPFRASRELAGLLQRIGRIVNVEAGTMLFSAREETKGVYLVVSGKLALWYGPDPLRITRVAEKNCLLGLPATIRKKPYSLSAEAVADSVLYLVTPEQITQVLSSYPSAGTEILGLLAEEISALQRLTAFEIHR